MLLLSCDLPWPRVVSDVHSEYCAMGAVELDLSSGVLLEQYGAIASHNEFKTVATTVSASCAVGRDCDDIFRVRTLRSARW